MMIGGMVTDRDAQKMGTRGGKSTGHAGRMMLMTAVRTIGDQDVTIPKTSIILVEEMTSDD